ncbi:TetR/AcrR family transcriptional regulator [uncultured Arsenicicoccus sp.]|uniref:TetR/AcrR family transcriptional regulator n=1 Tax=uncultured Arsenicicoccus sp. TaxID=491339 RepID=UPI002593253D|nr:helix-turn-helix domain-containing protein [uncultured Arsenicicoccus sp.]
MLDVAVARIEAHGMTVSLADVGMEAVIAEAGVSRATAYRRWSSREAFLADVLVETVRRTSLIPETERDLARLLEVVRGHRPRLGSAQGRRDLVVEALRVAVDLDVRRIVASPRWRTFVSLAATYQGLPEGGVRDAVGEALAEAEDAFTTRRTAIYAHLVGLIGYRLAPPLEGDAGFRALADATGAMMTGVVLRALPRPRWLDERHTARLLGSSQEADWSDPERLLVGLLLSHLEPDPDLAWDDATIEGLLARLEGEVVELLAGPTRPVAPASGPLADRPKTRRG